MLGDNSAVVPPDPMPNSEVKRSCADGSVGFPHVRVGHRQAPNYDKPQSSKEGWGFFVIRRFDDDDLLEHGIIKACRRHFLMCENRANIASAMVHEQCSYQFR